MSLESKIDELIAALDRNTAAKGATSTVVREAPAAAEAPRKGPGRPPKKTEEQVAAELMARVKATEEAAEAQEEVAGPTKADAAKALQELIAANRDEAVKLLAKHNAKSLGGVSPDKYGEFIAEANEILLSA
jgi:hypothetical protein